MICEYCQEPYQSEDGYFLDYCSRGCWVKDGCPREDEPEEDVPEREDY